MVGEGKGERGGGGEAAGKRRQERAKGSYSTWVGCKDLLIPSGRQCGCEESIDREGEHPGATCVMAHDSAAFSRPGGGGGAFDLL